MRSERPDVARTPFVVAGGRYAIGPRASVSWICVCVASRHVEGGARGHGGQSAPRRVRIVSLIDMVRRVLCCVASSTSRRRRRLPHARTGATGEASAARGPAGRARAARAGVPHTAKAPDASAVAPGTDPLIYCATVPLALRPHNAHAQHGTPEALAVGHEPSCASPHAAHLRASRQSHTP